MILENIDTETTESMQNWTACNFCGIQISVYHMALLLFSGELHVINNVMETRIILSVGTSNVKTTSVTTMQIFIEINKRLRRYNRIKKVNRQSLCLYHTQSMDVDKGSDEILDLQPCWIV